MAWLAKEIWQEVRPYVRAYFTDFLIFLMLWGMLWVAHFLSRRLPIEGSAAVPFLLGAHEAGVALSYVVLAILTVWDTLQLRRKHQRRR